MCLAGVGGFGSHSTWKEQAAEKQDAGAESRRFPPTRHRAGKPGLRGYFKKYINNTKGRARAFPCSFVSGRTRRSRTGSGTSLTPAVIAASVRITARLEITLGPAESLPAG